MSTNESERWTAMAKEDYFQFPSRSEYEKDLINSEKVRCAPSTLAPPPGKGVFAKCALKKGEVVEWGIAFVVPNVDVRTNDTLYSWSCVDRSVGAALSGCALFYNTQGDNSNCRCVPYHAPENRFEIYALRDIDAGEELTIRYDSMNYRDGMVEVKAIVGELKHGDK